MSRRWSTSTRLRSHGQEPPDDFAESSRRRQSERQRARSGTLDRMSYAVEWIWAPVLSGMVLLVLIVPEFAAIAIVVATIAVLVAALAALVGLVALAAVALASPYLLVRSVRRRLSPTKNTMDPLARDSGADRLPDRVRVLRRAHVTAFAHDEPGQAGAMLEDATRDAA